MLSTPWQWHQWRNGRKGITGATAWEVLVTDHCRLFLKAAATRKTGTKGRRRLKRQDSEKNVQFLLYHLAVFKRCCCYKKEEGGDGRRRGQTRRKENKTKATHFIEIIRVEIDKAKGFVQRERTVFLATLIRTQLGLGSFGFRRRQTVGLAPGIWGRFALVQEDVFACTQRKKERKENEAFTVRYSVVAVVVSFNFKTIARLERRSNFRRSTAGKTTGLPVTLAWPLFLWTWRERET